ncbi:putative E3 ubiquitin-protein ligase RHA2B [Acorus gramineus]|uniref:E3 ubiquitin-protein ligase RHA2B n=1 Tax=Acorus gramineus TaxID=55184 RepID=A0AAV9AYS1_ACOGR|nr:putative E3 ubiquitin-protein ligase RHA2B [Acorus gramineus]
MGLSNSLSEESLPILLIVIFANCYSHLLSLLRQLLNPPLPISHPTLPYRTCPRSASVFGSSTDDDCVFCLERLREGERVRWLDCRHVFHKDCIDGWFRLSNLTCPVCRSPILVAGDGGGDVAESRVHWFYAF